MKNTVSLLLDTTGPGLYKRGYRAVGVAAPLRETLAAALVLLSGYRGRDPFCDPFCGSGTIPIEAALIAKNRAPGLNRRFSAQKWTWLPSRVWVDGAGEAMDLEYHGNYEIWGGDIDPAAVQIARENAEKAEVEEIVRVFSRRCQSLFQKGALWTNRQQSALWRTADGKTGSRGIVPRFWQGSTGTANWVAHQPSLLSY